jgi:hypothetical protein
MYDGWGWRPYVSVAERRLEALREMDERRKKGHSVSPGTIKGRTIVNTFWGNFSKGVMETHLPAECRPVPFAEGD